MRVLIIHEWFAKFGGSENVTKALCSIFKSEPDLFTLWNEDPEAIPTNESFLKYFKAFPKEFRALMSPLAHSLWKGEYDLIISSSHLFAHNARVRGSKGATHVSYIHTPARYLWETDIDQRLSHLSTQPLSKLVQRFLKFYDVSNLGRVDHFLANSQNVQDRILSYWKQNSTIIVPPVNFDFYSKFFVPDKPNELTIISAGRLVRYKRHDLAIELASLMRCKLIIAGAGPEEENLRKLAHELGVRVDFVLNPTNDQLGGLLARAHVLFHGGHEDFGILPIEAMSCGTPVVGFNIAGLKETVNSKNGRLVQHFSEMPSAVMEAITLDRTTVSQTAEAYSLLNFRRKFARYLIGVNKDYECLIKDELLE